MDNVKEAQYDNLRKCFNENLVKPILGDNYYNMAMDVYSADEETIKDLKKEFDYLKSGSKLYIILLIISLISNVFLILSKLL